MKIYEGSVEGVKQTLLFDGKRHLYFVNVPVAVETTALEALCKGVQQRA
jgi:hypothetical protein